MPDMALIIGGELLQNPTEFKRIYQRNETDRRTLGGTLFTDFINLNRDWEMTWKLISEADYNTINQLFFDQYENGTYPYMQFDAYSIYAPVKIELTDQQIKHNGNYISGFSIIIKEQLPVS